jgi:hypothetical protein
MPILAEQPYVFPEDLLHESISAQEPGYPEFQRCWWVIYTRSRQEKALARDLFANQIPFYLPQAARYHLIRRRRFRTLDPVFPGYVFLFGTPEERVDSLKTNRISRILPVKRPEPVAAGSPAVGRFDRRRSAPDGGTAPVRGPQGPHTQWLAGRLRGHDHSATRNGSASDRGEFLAAGGVHRDQ